MAKSFTVFVCSTFTDLMAERESVLNAIRCLLLKHDSMEFFGARPERPIETCLEEVRKSDILVVIVGHRYGSLVPGVGTSFSQAEYEEGCRLRKPCLVYIRDDNTPILPRYIEQDPDKRALLERWKAMLQERHTAKIFTNGEQLAVQVAADLSRVVHGQQHVIVPSPPSLAVVYALRLFGAKKIGIRFLNIESVMIAADLARERVPRKDILHVLRNGNPEMTPGQALKVYHSILEGNRWGVSRYRGSQKSLTDGPEMWDYPIAVGY